MRISTKTIAVLWLLSLLSFSGAAIYPANSQSWAAAVVPLAKARTQAENCVKVLKRVGNSSQLISGELTYGNAKSDSDSVIAGLIITLATGNPPGSLPDMQGQVLRSLTGLAEFCASVKEIVSAARPPGDGERGIFDDLVKIPGLESLIKGVVDGVAALYNNYRGDAAATRKIIQTQLEAAKWPDFAQVEPAKQ
jgi:hypothetical protein